MLSPSACSTDGRLNIYTVIYGGKVSLNKQAALCIDFCLNLEERREVERTKVRSQCERAQHISTVWRLQQLREQNGWSIVWYSHDLSNANSQETKGITVWSYNPFLNHRKGFSPGICLFGGITLHLIRCVRKVKLAKIISQLLCSLRIKNSSFKCVTVLLRMCMQTHTKCPAWGFRSFRVFISPLHYLSVGAAEQREIKTNSNTGTSRKKELSTL